MDTCHECCNTITTLIDESNDERDILESKFYLSLKFNKVLTELLKKTETDKMFGKNVMNHIIQTIGRNMRHFDEGIDFPIQHLNIPNLVDEDFADEEIEDVD